MPPQSPLRTARFSIGIAEANAGAGVEGVLLVSDDGVGMPSRFDISGSTTLGLQLVQLLCQQLRGKLEINYSHPTGFNLRFPIDGLIVA